jgi:hypothetical protein
MVTKLENKCKKAKKLTKTFLELSLIYFVLAGHFRPPQNFHHQDHGLINYKDTKP